MPDAAYYAQNKDRILERLRIRYAQQTTAQRDRRRQQARLRHVNKTYGLTQANLDDMRRCQDGKCHICQRALPERFHIDHEHESGVIRGLLCGGCNTGIGFLQDNPEVVKRAATYLEEKQKMIDELYDRLESRMQEVESMLSFIMEISTAKIQVGSPLDPKGQQILTVPFKALYREVKLSGGKIIDVPSQPSVSGAPPSSDDGVGAADREPGERADVQTAPGSAEIGADPLDVSRPTT